MFEAVTIDRSRVDVGSVAEALVYYGRVTLAANGGSLVKFVQEFGGDNLLRIIDSGLLQLTTIVAGGQPSGGCPLKGENR